LFSPSASSAGYALDAQAAHWALVQAIEALAPMAEHTLDDPLHSYAFLREADHLWAIGAWTQLIACLRSRVSYIPRENLERWKQWPPRFKDRFGDDHAIVLEPRRRLAHGTGEGGDAREALLLLRELLWDRARVRGPDPPETLSTRRDIARWAGEAGD